MRPHALMVVPWMLLVLAVGSLSFETETTTANSEGKNNATTTTSDFSETNKKTEEDMSPPEKNWGSYYDPKEFFCGKYDCYKILGFDYETWGRNPPSTKEITRSYRTLSRRWHPDKNRGRGAKDRFIKINKAYGILTDPEKRKEYDFLRERPDEYFYKYGSNVLFQYAPKSDVVFVTVLLLAIGSAISWFVQKQRWQTIADHIVKAAVEGSGPRDGGSTESIQVRKEAEEILKKRKESDEESANGKNKNKVKLTKKEMKEQDQEDLRPIIIELVKNIQNFGAGFHQPTWRDLLFVKMTTKWPVAVFQATTWQAKYALRRMRKLELNQEEREVLTRRAVGETAWEAASDEDRAKMVTLDLWKSVNLEEWREQQEFRMLSLGDQKRYNRWKKKKGGKNE